MDHSLQNLGPFWLSWGSRCKKCKKYNKLDPKNTPKNFGTFWTLFTPIFAPLIWGCGKKKQNRKNSSKKWLKIFVAKNWTKFKCFAKLWAVLIELGSRCKKCKKYNKLDPKNTPKNFGTFWTLFTTYFCPLIWGCGQKKKTVEKSVRSKKWLKILVFF